MVQNGLPSVSLAHVAGEVGMAGDGGPSVIVHGDLPMMMPMMPNSAGTILWLSAS